MQAHNGWGKGGNVISAGWQVTLCDPIWHVSSRSGAVLAAQTAIRFLTCTYLPPFATSIAQNERRHRFISTTSLNLQNAVNSTLLLVSDDLLHYAACITVRLFTRKYQRKRPQYCCTHPEFWHSLKMTKLLSLNVNLNVLVMCWKSLFHVMTLMFTICAQCTSSPSPQLQGNFGKMFHSVQLLFNNLTITFPLTVNTVLAVNEHYKAMHVHMLPLLLDNIAVSVSQNVITLVYCK